MSMILNVRCNDQKFLKVRWRTLVAHFLRDIGPMIVLIQKYVLINATHYHIVVPCLPQVLNVLWIPWPASLALGLSIVARAP